MGKIVLSLLLGLNLEGNVTGLKIDTKDYQASLSATVQPYGFTYLFNYGIGLVNSATPISYGTKQTSATLRLFDKTGTEDFSFGIGGNFRALVLHGTAEYYSVERWNFSAGPTMMFSVNPDRYPSPWNVSFIFDLNLPPAYANDILGISVIFSFPLN